jgi:hypothetical protein
MLRWTLYFSLLAATVAIAGPYDQPYAIVERGDPSEVRKEAVVAITKIDGVSTRNTRKSDPISPGKHRVTLHFESARGSFRPEFQEIDMDLAPCTVYRIVAQYESKMGPDWTPKVYTETLRDCQRKFGKAAAAKK